MENAGRSACHGVFLRFCVSAFLRFSRGAAE
jgi:hypothetical protein